MDEQVKTLIDFAIGDGSIPRYDNSYRFKLEHSTKQIDYFRHKVDKLYSLGFTGKERLNEKVLNSKTYHTISCDFHINEAIKIAHKYICNNGRKCIDKHLLKVMDARTLAYWYMDDGSPNKTSTSSSSPGNGYRYYYTYPIPKLCKIRLYTYQFSEYEQNLIRWWLFDKFEINSKLIYGKRDGMFIVINNLEDRKLFIETIKPYIIPSMQYKITGLLSYKSIKPINVHRKRLNEETPNISDEDEATVQGPVVPA